ncbi:EAL domain-containing protein [Burkholderia cenocepacia]|nr:EAL domain-containing protein [Burkholderia cenocepacia]
MNNEGHYGVDIAIADKVLRAIEVDAFTLVMRPVYSLNDGHSVLYFDCSTRCRTFESDVALPRTYLPSAARMGLMPRFKFYLLMRVLDLLKYAPYLKLDVSISGQSLEVGLQWEGILYWLAESPDVAARLVVEVSEDVEIKAENARSFLRRL